MLLIDILALIGTAAFTISGVLVGIKKRLDLFGVIILAIITASGGGLTRDVVLGDKVPVFFTQSQYFITIIMSACLTCIAAYFAYSFLSRIYMLIQIFDAIGLGVFSVLAVNKSIEYGVPVIGIMFTGIITGIGGGILRDMLVNDIPLVLKSEIYALASAIGCIVFYLLYDVVNLEMNLYLSAALIFAVRMISIKLNLNLPAIPIKEKQ